MGRLERTSYSEKDTLAIAETFTNKLAAGAVVCLQGGLGAGKTHFVKGMARALGINPGQVHSPTFTLIHEYKAAIPLYHFDCYRMESAEEALEIGVEEYFYGDGISVVEWPERIEPLIPAHAIWLNMEIEGKSKRKIVISKSGENLIYLD